MKEVIDGAFVAAPDDRVPKGYCVIFRGEKQKVYAGPIERSTVQSGDRMYLNPADFHRINAKMKKYQN
jgi:hypothetical protein